MTLQFKEIKKTITAELQLLQEDSSAYRSTSVYLTPLIDEVLRQIVEITAPEKEMLKIEILNDVSRAAQLYMQRSSEHGLPEYHFSTYFGWFMSEKIEYFKKPPHSNFTGKIILF